MKTLIRLTLSLLPFASYAQKADPPSGKSPDYSTYSVEVHVSKDVLKNVDQPSIENAIAIQGLKKVTSSPSLTVSFTAQDLVIIRDSVREFREAQKDSAGNARISYYMEVLYSLKCDGKCTNAQNQLVYSASWGVGQSKFTSAHMATRKEAEDYWTNNKESLKSSFIVSIINPSIVAMGNKLSALVPYPSAKN